MMPGEEQGMVRVDMWLEDKLKRKFLLDFDGDDSLVKVLCPPLQTGNGSGLLSTTANRHGAR